MKNIESRKNDESEGPKHRQKHWGNEGRSE